MSSTEKVILTEGSLEDIADAIREKNGSETTYKPREMAPAIRALNTDTEWGEIGGTLSNQTDLQNALDSLNADLASKQDASTAVRSVNGNLPTNGAVTVAAEDIEAEGIGDRDVSGNPIIVNDAMASVAKGLTVDLEPVQDLHGYDHPWVAGGGNNLYVGSPSFSGYNNASEWAVDSSTYNGHEVRTRSGSWAGMYKVLNLTVGTYTFSVSVKASSPVSFFIYTKDGSSTAQVSKDNETKTATTSWARYSITFDVTTAGTTGLRVEKSDSSVTLYISEYQLESGSSATSYAPYSNICPIYPHTQAEVQRTGKNLIEIVNTTRTSNGITYTVNADGSVTASGTATALSYFILSSTTNSIDDYLSVILKSGMSVIPSTNGTKSLLFRYTDGTYSGNLPNGQAVTLQKDVGMVYFQYAGGTSVTDGKVYPMIRLASETDATFEPYQEQSAVLPFGQDVYGCHADFVTGKVTVTHANVDLGTLTWTDHPTSVTNVRRMRAPLTHKPYANSATMEGACSAYPMVSANDTYLCTFGLSGDNTSSYIHVYDPRYNTAGTASDFTTAVNGVKLVYPLATPIELDLNTGTVDPAEWLQHFDRRRDDKSYVSWLDGDNVQAEIDEFENGLNNVIGSIAFIENSTAKTSHAVGEYIIINGIFCKVISAISSGETLSFGTNIQATSIGAELKAIWSQLNA